MKKTSIIMVCYDQLKSSRFVSQAAVGSIVRYTNPSNYELIVVDCAPKDVFRDDMNILNKYMKIITLQEDPGYYPALNLGAEEATGDYLCFIENDVFVPKDWLPKLSYYLDTNKTDAILPNQLYTDYKQQAIYDFMSLDEAFNNGQFEQGLILIKKEAFNKIGGFDKNLKQGFGWKRFYEQMGENNIRFNKTAAVTITHIQGFTFFNTREFDWERFKKIEEIENTYLNERRIIE